MGLCVASMYSNRRGFKNWALATLQAGFSQLYVYYTTVQDPAALNPLYGTVVQIKGEFVAEDVDGVQYLYFQAPARSYTFAQSTLYTECIHRNRLKHKLLAIADPDEFFWRPPSNESLQEYLTALLPNDTASLIFPDIMYPEPCQAHRSFAEGVNPLVDSHLYYPFRGMGQPKSIVMPTRSFSHMVHTLNQPEPGYQKGKDMLPKIGYWKHVRQRGGGCSVADHKDLLDDRDESTFQDIMQNASRWL